MRKILTILAVFIAVACSPASDLNEPVDPIGNFKLGTLVVKSADEIQKGPLSRDATAKEWEQYAESAFKARFTRYSGDTEYHIGIIVDGFILAQVGVPVVVAPKSALIFRVIVMDAATNERLTGEPHKITVLETFSAGSIVSSGLTQTREQQLADLSASAAKATERWMRQQPWFFPEQTQ